MEQNPLTSDRRSFHRCLIGGMGVTVASSFAVNGFADEPEPHPQSCRDAVERLLKGNERFVSGNLRHPHISQQWRERLTNVQNPFGTILGCSDSRVPPEMLFDQGFGDLFVIRVAGNVVDPDVTGSVEYGVEHLKTPVVVVMGHEGCGAVTAALQSNDRREQEPNEIRSLVSKIRLAINGLSNTGTIATQISPAVEANVRWSVKQLKAVPTLAKAIQEQRTLVIGCVYDLNSGRVRTL